MTQTIPVYRYEVRSEGAPPEWRWSLAPMHPNRYAAGDEPAEAHPMSNAPADVGQMRPAGHVEAPDGTKVFSTDPPILEIPGCGLVSLEAAIGIGEGHADQLGHLVRWRPAAAGRGVS